MMWVSAALAVLSSSQPGGTPIPAQYASEPIKALERWTEAKALLGKRLFESPLLSKDQTLSCGSCHQPPHGFGDPRRFSAGVNDQRGQRNAPTLINRALGAHQFWDGRAESLEAQALGPIENPVEMALPIDEAIARLKADPSLRRAFDEVFGHDPTPEALAEALAAYERTIFSIDSPFDRYLAGDTRALSPAARRGLELFGGKAGCGACHAGINFTDEDFHALGIGDDAGRAAVTQLPEDQGAFKTPTLRDVAKTAPYMHDGSLATLEEVIELYDRGGGGGENVDLRVQKLGLSKREKKDLVEFLKALSGTVVDLSGPVVSSQR